MRFLNHNRIRSNRDLAIEVLSKSDGIQKSAKLKFIDAINNAQGTTINAVPGGIFFEFENQELVDLLANRTVFSSDEVERGKLFFSQPERKKHKDNLESALALIGQVDPSLLCSIKDIIGSVASYKIADRDGGSVSCCIGLIWLSPHLEWKIEYYAEMIVHEFIHNSLFLEDMIHGIMPSPDLLSLPQAQTISAIRKTKRDYDKAFHSACVTAGIMYFYKKLGMQEKALSYIGDLRNTVYDLSVNQDALRTKGLDILSDNGRNILSELNEFVHEGDFDVIDRLRVAYG